MGGFRRTSSSHARALGKSGLFVYKALLAAGKTLNVREGVTATGKTRPTITRALAKLAGHGLARQDGDRWQAVEVTADELDRIAMACGTLGKTDRRIEQHQAEREKRASVLITEQKRRWQRRQKA